MSINSYPSPIERRFCPRIPFESLALATNGSQTFILQSRDVCLSGVFLYAKLSKLNGLEEGMELRVELCDTREPICFSAIITRHNEPRAGEEFAMGIGMQICDIDGANRLLLEEIIATNA